MLPIITPEKNITGDKNKKTEQPPQAGRRRDPPAGELRSSRRGTGGSLAKNNGTSQLGFSRRVGEVAPRGEELIARSWDDQERGRPRSQVDRGQTMKWTSLSTNADISSHDHHA
jgi:hypothetical protein